MTESHSRDGSSGCLILSQATISIKCLRVSANYLILDLSVPGYSPVDRDEVSREIYEQAEKYRKHRHL